MRDVVVPEGISPPSWIAVVDCQFQLQTVWSVLLSQIVYIRFCPTVAHFDLFCVMGSGNKNAFETGVMLHDLTLTVASMFYLQTL